MSVKISINHEDGLFWYSTEAELLSYETPEHVALCIDAEVSEEKIVRWNSVKKAFDEYQQELRNLLKHKNG